MLRSLAIFTAIVLGFAILYLGYDQFAIAKLTVHSKPSGAAVRLNGKLIGTTPLNHQPVATGRLKLTLQHSHFAEFEELIELKLGNTVERYVDMPRAPGQLTLLSNPKGASVAIDGKPIEGKTPIDIELSSGQYQVTMSDNERRTVSQQVAVVANAVTKVNLTLAKDPHRELTISATPSDASIELIDFPTPYTPGVRLPVGEYSVRVSRVGYLPGEFRYKVGFGSNVHQVDLVRDYGVFSVATIPATATVSVGYLDQGGWQRKTVEPNMRLPVGPVEVRASAMGRRSQVRKLNLTNAGLQLTLTLPVMKAKKGDEFADLLRVGGEGPELVTIAAGKFTMGSVTGPMSEKPVRLVQLTQPFAMTKYEITVGDYLQYIDATGAQLHKKLTREQPSHPMRLVSWQQAQDYAQWLSAQTNEKYRLPSESEWEYAARAGTAGIYSFGSDPVNSCAHANLADLAAAKVFTTWDVVDCSDGYVRTAPVGSYLANPFGLHDMAGNVAEWVAECGLPEYKEANAEPDVMGSTRGCMSHGFRGGSWDSGADEIRVAYRNTSGTANEDRGIRLVREF